MTGRPLAAETAAYFFTYIDQTDGEDPVALMEQQLEESGGWLATISEADSLRRYSPDKWSIRQVLNHITDTERAFAFRALWFARGFTSELPSYDPDVAASGAEADRVDWGAHIEEFYQVRLSTISMFCNLPETAWLRSGMAGGNSFTPRALAFIIVGHFTHHLKIMRERYL